MTPANGWTGTLRGMPVQGQTAERSKTMRMRDIELYTEITGDRNPLHYDEQAARESVFGGLIVQGGVTSGLLNALVAEAVYVGDTARASLEILSVREDKPICKIAVEVRNQKGEVCLSGQATTYTAPLGQT